MSPGITSDNFASKQLFKNLNHNKLYLQALQQAFVDSLNCIFNLRISGALPTWTLNTSAASISCDPLKKNCLHSLIVHRMRNYHYRKHIDIICEICLSFTKINCDEKKVLIIMSLFSIHIYLATLFETFIFALAFLHILVMCTSNINLLPILTPLVSQICNYISVQQQF